MFVVKELFTILLIWCMTTHKVQSTRRSASSSFTINSADFSLLWIDDNIREYSDENLQIQLLLRELIPTVEFESDLADAISKISRIKYSEKTLLVIVSGQKASLLFQYLSHYDLDDDIGALFIFCNNPGKYRNLRHDKLIGIFTDSKILVESVRAIMLMVSSKTVKSPVNLLDQEQKWLRMVSPVTLNNIWYQHLLEILKFSPRDEQAKQEMVKKSQEYYAEQKTELLQIENFRNQYTSEMAIEWYTADSFVHKLVNKALRSEDIDLLYAFRFFISDLSAEIKREHIRQQKISGSVISKITSGSGSAIKLFSGQQLPRSELDKLGQSIGTVIAINSFFSTSMRLSEAQDFAKRGVIPTNMQRALIEISFDTSSKGMINFAEIEHRARFRSEREVLFNYDALFNVTFVEYDWVSEIWNVKMTAISKSSIKEHPYYSIVNETFIHNHSANVAFGIIMAHGFGKNDEGIRYFDQLLSSYSSDYIDVPDILQQRAILHEKNGEHTLAFHDYEQALEIRRERVRENLLGMASVHSNIGILQMATSNFSASLKSHQEALSIFEQFYTTEEDHATKAKVNENIGLTYQRDGMPSKALEYLTSAQSIYERILPEKHLLTIEILGHIGAVHEASNNFSSAIELFHRQLNWSEEILPLDHPLLNIYLDSVLRVYTKINQASKMNALFDERLQKLNKILGEYHPLIPRLILMVASLLESSQPLEAIRLYDQALQISESSKQSDRSILLKSHQNLARLYRKFENLKEALSHALRALSYQQQISSEKENRLFEADELHNIGSIYLEMGSFTDALQYLTKSLTMHQPTYAIDHPTVQAILFDIGRAANQSRFN